MQRLLHHILIVVFTLILGLFLIRLDAAAFGQQHIVYVRGPGGVTSAPSPSNPGDSWSNAYAYLQDGLTRAGQLNPNDSNQIQVWVRGSSQSGGIIYVPASQSSSFNILKNVKVYSGFNGGESALNQRNPFANITILSADIDGDDNWMSPSYDPDHVGTHDDNGDTVIVFQNPTSGTIGTETVLDGFTIQGARGGGAIQMSFASPLIRGCRIVDNFSDSVGGGISSSGGGEPEIRNCKIERNRAQNSGGGVFLDVAGKLLNCEIADNRAKDGGGVALDKGFIITMFDCTVVRNAAIGGSALGGIGGGVLIRAHNEFQTGKLLNCLVADNTAVSTGAGVFSAQPTVSIINCTIANNDAYNPSGISVAGGVYIEGAGSKIENSIIWGNTADFDPGISAGTGVKVNYSNTQGGVWSGPTDCVGSPPCNKSETPGFVSAGSGNYRLSCGSPCINTGSSELVPLDIENVDEDSSTSEPTPDRDLRYRWIDVVDMGAYEKQPGGGCLPGDLFPPPCGDGTVNIDDLLLVINHWSGPNCSARPCLGNGNGDNVVDIDDLLLVINGWGSCTVPATVPTTVQDCISICSQTSTTEDYQNCMNKCLLAIGQ